MSQTGRFGNTSKRLPIVFCLDVSPSMNWDVDNSDIIPIELLNDSVNTFIREINSDGRTKSSAEVAYVTFSTNIEVDSQFMPARNLDPSQNRQRRRNQHGAGSAACLRKAGAARRHV